MKTKITFLLCLFAFTAILPLSAAKYYLYAGTDSNPWGAPVDGTVTQVTGTLNTILNAFVENDVVWIAKGTYTVDASIVLASGIQVYGGFAGTETSISERLYLDADNTVVEPWEFKNPTTIYGVGFTGTAVDYAIVNSGANSYTLNGLTIEGHNTTSDKGAAIYTNARPTIEKCIIRNINQTASTAANGGAGIYSEVAGGAYIYSCLIENCVTNKCGGAINAYKKVTVKGCVLRNNFASTASVSKGGAISLQNNADAPNTSYIINNAIYNNSSTYQGGALQLQGTNAEPCRIINNTIANNYATSSVGGIIGLGISTKLYNNIVYNNWEGATAGTIKNLRTSLTSATIDLQYSAYNGGTAVGTGSSFATTGNINNLSAPGFVNPSTTKGYSAIMPNDVLVANFALQSTSTLINAGGSSTALTDLPSNDLLGYERPFGTANDMGAYEYGSTNLTTVNDLTNAKMLNLFRANNRSIISNVDGLVEIFSVSGKLLISKNVSVGSQIALTSGFYVIRVSTAEATVNQKIVL